MIKPIGSFHQIDKDGYIGNPARYPVLQQDYAAVVEYIIEKVSSLLGEELHSMYLRGSVAKGEAIPYISDIDTLLITHQPLSPEDRNELEKLQDSISELYPFITKLELHAEPLPEVEKRWLRFLLKTSCVCVYGEDLGPGIEPFKVSDHGKGQLRVIVKQIEEFEEELNTIDDSHAETIKEGCVWICKAVLRAGFELVMERDNSYTRDLYPCYERFSNYYPEYEPTMRRVLELAIEPVSDKQILSAVSGKIKNFFKNQLRGIT